MIIHELNCTLADHGTVRLSARITTQANLPETLWFDVPEHYAPHLSDSLNGFVVCLLPLAMALNESIEVRGTMSPRLRANLDTYQDILHFWYPDVFHRTHITATNAPEATLDPHAGAACPFSGGVDSTYVVWSHLPAQEVNPHKQVKRALFVHGFDIPLSDTKTFSVAYESYRKFGDDVGIEIIGVATNAKEFASGPGLNWALTHSAVLVGTALLFEKVITRFYFPENDTLDYALPPLGVHPTIVPLLSTETFQSTSNTATVSKLEKIRTISQWPATYSRLRVCWRKPDGLKNCGKCWKCIQTMTILDMVGALGKYTTFLRPLERKNIRRMDFYPQIYHHYRWLVTYARETRRRDMLFDYTVAFVYSKMRNRLRFLRKR